MMERDEIESKIEKAIEEFVGEHWASTQSVCYLSSIGIYLNVTVPDSRTVLSNGLREFLRQNPVVQGGAVSRSRTENWSRASFSVLTG